MSNDCNIKQISFQDAMDLARDEMINQEVRDSMHDRGGLAGEVTMTDNTGRICFQKRHNLIVLRGRTFGLEKLFDTTIGNNGVNNGAVPYVSDIDRKILAFGVGKGGTPNSDPFSPYAPPPIGVNGVRLATKIPFRAHDTSQSGSGNPLLFVPSNEIANYGGAEKPQGSLTLWNYYLKAFDAVPTWVFNEQSNTVYKKILLSVTEMDCRTAQSNIINELALYFARATGLDARGGTVFTNPEMFSRITFPTEFMSVNKALAIEYRIYA
jgi:hypothetical protein